VKSAGLLGALLAALAFLPLLGGFGYEAALLAGLLAPGFAATAAFWAGRPRRGAPGVESAAARTFELGPRTAEIGALHAGVVILVAALHDSIRGSCELWQGAVLVGLGPAFGALLGAVWGGTVAALLATILPAHLATKRGFILLAPLGPAATALFALGEFYFGPSIYAYDPFAGYFAGPLYDTIPFELQRLAVFRVGSALSLVAVWCVGRSLAWNPGEKPRLSVLRPRALGLGVACGLASAMHALFSPALGLATTEASLARELHGSVRRGVCLVRHSPWVAAEVAARVAFECEGHVRAHRKYFDLRGPGPTITVHLFASAEEKGRLMGARTTYLAKPWRREVFVQVAAFPHPVLGHELAHAVSAEFGVGPFRIAGAARGLLPDPGRIEGFAVAAAPNEEGDATEAEWARAMLDLGQLPPSRQLFTLGFLGAAAVKSYTSAGAFVGYLHGAYGPTAMKRWYRGEDLEKLTGRTWSELDRDYRAALASEHVSARVRALAEEIFSRPSIFGRSCPHAADRALERAHALCPISAREAEREVQRALELDPTRQDAEGMLPACYASAGDLAAASTRLARLGRSPAVSGREKVRALVSKADLAWIGGRSAEARQLYDEALRGALTGSEARAVSMKLWALDRPEPVASAVRRWLALGAPGGTDPAARLAPLFEWHEQGPDRGVAAYLLGLALIESDRARGRALLEAALESGELEPPFVVEAERRLLVAACLAGDRAELERRAAALEAQDEVPLQARRAPRLQDRCEVGAPP